MNDNELFVFVSAFESSGFTGSINWYRNLDRNWHLMADVKPIIHQPALMIYGELMTQAGFDSIETAKQNGSWNILDEVEELINPNDLEKAFKEHKGSKNYFLSLSKSTRKIILGWIVAAKRKQTRQKRIDEVVESAGQNLKPKHLR